MSLRRSENTEDINKPDEITPDGASPTVSGKTVNTTLGLSPKHCWLNAEDSKYVGLEVAASEGLNYKRDTYF